MSPKNLVLFLVLPHQIPDPESFLFTLLDERIDVLRHLFGRGTSLGNVLIMVEQNPPDFPEVVLVLLDFFHKSSDCRCRALDEVVRALHIFTRPPESRLD